MDNDLTVFTEKLKRAFEANSLTAPNEEQTLKFYKFAQTLISTNKLFNLSAITDIDGIVYKHFTDCAMISQFIPEGAKLLDVGAGAGFPSVPLAILREDISVTALDSTNKKIGFISDAAKLCEIPNLSAVCGRAEELGAVKSQMREKFDAVTARAVAALPVLCELCIPFIKVGGVFVAMRSGSEDVSVAVEGAKKLGCECENVYESSLVCEDETFSRRTAIFRKVKATNAKYPRRYSAIVKEPL